MAKQKKRKRPLTAMGQIRKIDIEPLYTGIRAAFDAYKQFASTYGLPFEITQQEFIETTAKNCGQCNAFPKIKLTSRHYRNGLLRIVKTDGFSKQNCIPACMSCMTKNEKE